MPCSSFISTMSVEHAPAGGRVEPVGRFVQHDQLRSVHDGLGELRHLLHAVRIGPQLPVARLAEPHVEQNLVGLLERGVRGKAGELGHLAQKGDRRHLADERVVLGHVADTRPGLAPAAPAIEAENAGAPGARAEESEQRQDQRGLAGAVGPQQPDGLARARRAKAAGDPAQDLPPPQPDLQVLELDDRYGVHSVTVALCSLARVRLSVSSSITSRIRPGRRVRLAA